MIRLPALLLLGSALHAAPAIDINQIGYELSGPKIAVLKSDAALNPTSFEVLDVSSSAVVTGTPIQRGAVPGWGATSYWSIDFSSLTEEGTYRIRVSPGAIISDTFRVEKNLLFRATASSVVSFFNGMRNTMESDRKVGYFGTRTGTRDVYGGWNDATGDRGKYISHLSYANFMNPQQIPLVVWTLLKSVELNPEASQLSAARAEAGWGADYLLRIQDPAGYFYINIFDKWGAGGEPRQVCAWETIAGNKTADYQAALREGGGMAIAALARAARMKVSGDSTPAQYLAAARRGWEHLRTANTSYADDGRENIIDDYCGLLAATELHLATGEPAYRADAQARASSLMRRQHAQGWFVSDGGGRPFYHAVDEGLPIVALLAYLDADSSQLDSVRQTVNRNLAWYRSASSEIANPYDYLRLRARALPGGAGGGNLALKKPATASSSERADMNAAAAVDGAAGTRWSSLLGHDSEWIAVDLQGTWEVDRVVATWEAAYAKKYLVQVSQDGTNWTDVATAAPAAPGRVETKFAKTPARHVRLFGLERATAYGYSVHEFEVHGAAPKDTGTGRNAFFMPHSNETGYWWQGENARLGSLSAAFLLAARRLDPSFALGRDSTSRYALAQLDWILGRNPVSTSFVYGFGKADYPSYGSGTNLKGGICNGITSDATDESAPTFLTTTDPWYDSWRWIEQWLPHDAWFLAAVSALSWIETVPPQASALRSLPARSSFQARFLGDRVVQVAFDRAAGAGTSVALVLPDGRQVAQAQIPAGARAASLSCATTASGIVYVVVSSPEGRHAVALPPRLR